MNTKNKNSIWMGTAAGLVGATFWGLAAHDVPIANVLVPLSVALGGLISGLLFWRLLVEKEKKTIFRCVLAGGLTGLLFLVPSAIVLALLTVVFQINVPVSKRLSLASAYLIFGFPFQFYLATYFVPAYACMGGVIGFLQKRRKGKPSFSCDN
ncbi:hypothetical protein GO013_12590 [Pseudodesulfovibrio sp. JC047]|uniref:hypothetical protein n=1 Tax=Pseudodesulfovibrio sp. JC047 TaxID=2683199 RepID=UPI0013D74E7A|nr:hypothetical protein [Pseudodesulfovibrio sp. JC047]NDV20249.1 hypothetical protein [Pseudodesulfovibrio sp. JC047]